MRNHVNVFGRLKCDLGLASGMEVFIDYLGKLAPEAADLNEIIDACTQYPLKAAELFQQLAPLHRSQARNGFEYRLVVAFGALSAMPSDRKAMRFVAHALNQLQRPAVRPQDSGGVLAQQEYVFFAC